MNICLTPDHSHHPSVKLQINNQANPNNKKYMNQLSHGQRINFPTSFVRSVSFEKVRQGSLSSRTNKPEPQAKPQQKVQNKELSGLCQRLLTKKLIGDKIQSRDRKPMQPKLMMNVNEKSAIIKKQQDEKQMKQCTFKPKINKSIYPHRTVEEFVDQQMAYEKFKQDKVNQMRQMIRAKIDKENTFQPNLVDLAKNQYSKRTTGQVHDRLYEQWSKKRVTNQNVIAESVQKRPSSKTSTIKQKITTYSRKNSQKSIVQSKKHILTHNDLSQFNSSVAGGSKQYTLNNQNEGSSTNREYHDRSRQNSKSQKGLKITKHMDVQEVCEKKLRSRPMEQREQKKSSMTIKNKELYIKKTLREISHILSELGINEPNLNYLQMSLILEKMNFLDEQTNLNDRKYSYQIWQMLQGDVYESCPLANLIRIIFCLLGCHDFGLIQECLASFMGENCSLKKLVLTQKESKNIKVNFEQLYLNRLRKGQYLTNQPKSQQYSFKPFVSKNSKQMAQKYRQRIIQQSQQLVNKNLINYQFAQNGQVDHIDLLLLNDKRKQLKIKIKRQQAEKEKKRLEDEAMQGDKNKKRKQPSRHTQNQTGQSRYEYLYELGKNNIRTKKQKVPTEQISKQCTFQPNISTSKQHSRILPVHHTQSLQVSKNNQNDQIKDFQKSIFRMYEGRRIRQQSQNCTSKSNSMTQRSMISEQHRSKQEQVPELYLNVCMEGSEDIKVPVFSTDNMKTITHKVKVLMGLENAQDAKLEQILKLQILPTLQEIGMEMDLE